MTHYIYIPGLGDRMDFLRRLALRRWKSSRAKATLVPMRWTNKHESYIEKRERILDKINRLNSDDVVLVGESAGGPMALMVYMMHPDKISRVVTVCGYNRGADSIHSLTRRRNPAFYPLMQEADKKLDDLTEAQRSNAMTVYSSNDNVVSPEHTRIRGVKESVIHTHGHMYSIARILIDGPNKW